MLWHLILSKGLKADKTKIEVIQNPPLPTPLRDLSSFLGYIGFYLIILPHFANILMNRDREVIQNTRSRVKKITKLTNLKKLTRIEGYSDE